MSEGHPDKVCDQISDAVLDAYLENDPASRVACEVFATTDTVVVGGEITSRATVDIDALVRDVVDGIGYGYPGSGFEPATLAVLVYLKEQSRDIALGVDENSSLYGGQGAGDQGMMRLCLLGNARVDAGSGSLQPSPARTGCCCTQGRHLGLAEA